MRKSNLILIIACFLMACAADKSKNPHVYIKTKFGDIELELYADKAPLSIKAFLANIDAGYYNNATFYRVLNNENQPSNAPKAELIQGGMWRTNYKKATTLPGIPHESTRQTSLTHTDGVISWARQEPVTARSEFFICLNDQSGLDFGGENNPDGQGYAAFGKVVKGMNVVRSIYKQPENDQYFDPVVYIFKIVRK